jgi:hypothetical protein
MVQAWVLAADGDPEAQLWRMRVRLRNGQVTDARDDAIVAVQQAVDRQRALATVVRFCEQAAAEAGDSAAQGALVLAREFATLRLADAPAGGR